MDKFRVTIDDGGRKIAAIKALRSASRRTDIDGNTIGIMGLKEAKEMVESGHDGHFTVVMTKDQAFNFLLAMITDNEGFVRDAHMRIADIVRLDHLLNDITGI